MERTGPALAVLPVGACDMADVLEEFSAHRRSGPGGRGYEAQEPGKFEKPDIKRPPDPDLPEFDENKYRDSAYHDELGGYYGTRRDDELI